MRPVENRTPNRGSVNRLRCMRPVVAAPAVVAQVLPPPAPLAHRPPAAPRARVALLYAAAGAVAQQRGRGKCYAELSISGPDEIRALTDFYHRLPGGYSVRGNGPGYSRFIATISWKPC